MGRRELFVTVTLFFAHVDRTFGQNDYMRETEQKSLTTHHPSPTDSQNTIFQYFSCYMSSLKKEEIQQPIPFLKALMCGGMAGTSVDVALYPIDTIKTRLQSPHGFFQAGGFTGVFRGLGAVAAGSAPGAALFFSVYETLKPHATNFQRDRDWMPDNPAISHMISAATGETASCLVRVPTEVLKTKMQTNQYGTDTLTSTVRLVLSEPGRLPFNFLGGMYRGYGITLMREIPFALIQFPIYERAKSEWSARQGFTVTPLQAAACGSFGGAIAAAVTTPLDVMKTRLMLGTDKHGKVYTAASDVFHRIRAEEGVRTFFSGIQPRVIWISIGGFVFFGAYETYKLIIPFDL